MIKYLFCDLDDTLIRRYNNGTSGINKYNIQAIKKLENQGIKLVVNTARSPFFLNRFIGIEYNFDYIAWNGSEIYSDGRIIYSSYIDQTIIREFIHEYPELKRFIRITYSNGDTIFGDTKGSAYKLFMSFDEKRADYYNIICDNIFTYNSKEKISIVYLVFDACRQSDYYHDVLNNSAYANYLTFGRTTGKTIDITSIDCDKGKAIKNYLQSVGDSDAEFAVIGDSDNDISMFDTTEYSFCMQNGTHNALEHSSYHVKNVAECINLICRRFA